MTAQAFIALAALSMTLFTGLLGVTWRFATLASRLAENSAQLKERIEKFDLALLKLDRIPLLEQRIALLEDLCRTFVGHEVKLAKLETMIAELRARITEYRQRHASFPDLEEAK